MLSASSTMVSRRQKKQQWSKGGDGSRFFSNSELSRTSRNSGKNVRFTSLLAIILCRTDLHEFSYYVPLFLTLGKGIRYLVPCVLL